MSRASRATPIPPGHKETIGNSSLVLLVLLLVVVVRRLWCKLAVFLSLGEFSPNFDLKKSEPDLYKGFFMEQKRSKNPPLPNSPDFQEIFKNQIARFSC
jgi:hypothetical protein